MPQKQNDQVDSTEVPLSNLEKPLYHSPKITKGEVVEYYDRIAELMIPLIKDRYDTLRRFPDGIEKEGFYQKDASEFFPDWVLTERVASESAGSVNYVLCQNKKTLIYLTQLATLEHHPWLSRRDKPDKPDKLIFDLDPPRTKFKEVIFAAEKIRDLCKEVGLNPFLMTTGSKGLHIIIPLRRGKTFDEVRAFARDLAQLLAWRHPDRLTVEQRKNKRNGRVFLDTGRNARAQTGIAPYSLRAEKGAPVATPVHWRELKEKNFGPQSYTIRNIFKKRKNRQDPWKEFSSSSQSLTRAQYHLKKLLRREGELG